MHPPLRNPPYLIQLRKSSFEKFFELDSSFERDGCGHSRSGLKSFRTEVFEVLEQVEVKKVTAAGSAEVTKIHHDGDTMGYKSLHKDATTITGYLVCCCIHRGTRGCVRVRVLSGRFDGWVLTSSILDGF